MNIISNDCFNVVFYVKRIRVLSIEECVPHHIANQPQRDGELIDVDELQNLKVHEQYADGIVDEIARSCHLCSPPKVFIFSVTALMFILGVAQ